VSRSKRRLRAQAVSGLIASPRLGNAGHVHWMDAAHFAAKHNGQTGPESATNDLPYRDINLIRSFNTDKPYASLSRAGCRHDVLYRRSPGHKLALGFIAAGLMGTKVRCRDIPRDTTRSQIGATRQRRDMLTTGDANLQAPRANAPVSRS